MYQKSKDNTLLSRGQGGEGILDQEFLFITAYIVREMIKNKTMNAIAAICSNLEDLPDRSAAENNLNRLGMCMSVS